MSDCLERIVSAVAAMMLFALAAGAQEGAGVAVTAETIPPTDAQGGLRAQVRLQVPEGIQVYADEEHFFLLEVADSEGVGEVDLSIPEPVWVTDTFAVEGDKKVPVYKGATVFEVNAPIHAGSGDRWYIVVRLRYQACSETLCYPPESQRFRWRGSGAEGAAGATVVAEKRPPPAAPEVAGDSRIPEDFRLAARASGYMNRKKFRQFLDEGRGLGEGSGSLADVLQNGSVWLGLLLVFVAGMALNLTPCVLPMIPVNLAIIGAGSQASSRLRGFLMGGLYGVAIAITYGVLGLVVVLGGGTFGAINASPTFNLGIGILFFVLAAAMLGVFNIDFSRFSSGLDVKRWKGAPALLAGGMGVVTAVLAGACVAPVVIAVVLVSTRQYAAGNAWALLYPFLLGLGMGAPWPVAGAGLSFLPKPGGWMKWVKVAFGLFFIGLGIYYAALGLRLWQAQAGAEDSASAKPEFWMSALEPAFETARETGKPVLIDFATPWCKTCHAMDRTTLAHPEVQQELQQFVPVAYQVQDPDDPRSAALLEELGVIGFPTYIVLAQEEE